MAEGAKQETQREREREGRPTKSEAKGSEYKGTGNCALFLPLDFLRVRAALRHRQHDAKARAKPSFAGKEKGLGECAKSDIVLQKRTRTHHVGKGVGGGAARNIAGDFPMGHQAPYRKRARQYAFGHFFFPHCCRLHVFFFFSFVRLSRAFFFARLPRSWAGSFSPKRHACEVVLCVGRRGAAGRTLFFFLFPFRKQRATVWSVV